jgi:hypothetical protein
MGIERFPTAKRDLKKAIMHKDRGFALRLTPFGSTKHVKVANLDPDCLAASIPGSTQAFILVEREHLEERIQTSDTESSITISEEAAIRAIEMIDAEISGNKRLISRWRKKLSTGFGAFRQGLRRIARNPPKSNEVKKLEQEVRKLKYQINKESGTIIEMQIAGIIPMNGKVPFPLENIHQMHYGCDWLSMVWNGDDLHLIFIESNLTRTATNPSLTDTEGLFRTAVGNKRVFPHHCHHWVDMQGNMHWDRT